MGSSRTCTRCAQEGEGAPPHLCVCPSLSGSSAEPCMGMHSWRGGGLLEGPVRVGPHARFWSDSSCSHLLAGQSLALLLSPTGGQAGGQGTSLGIPVEF